jgi:hypothetical protein
MEFSWLRVSRAVTRKEPGERRLDSPAAGPENFRYNRGQTRRDGREAEGGGLLNRYRVVKLYRGFESLSLRQSCK